MDAPALALVLRARRRARVRFPRGAVDPRARDPHTRTTRCFDDSRDARPRDRRSRCANARDEIRAMRRDANRAATRDGDARRRARRFDRDARGLTDDDASQRTYATASAKGASGGDVKVRGKFEDAMDEGEGRDGEAWARGGWGSGAGTDFGTRAERRRRLCNNSGRADGTPRRCTSRRRRLGLWPRLRVKWRR